MVLIVISTVVVSTIHGNSFVSGKSMFSVSFVSSAFPSGGFLFSSSGDHERGVSGSVILGCMGGLQLMEHLLTVPAVCL